MKILEFDYLDGVAKFQLISSVAIFLASREEGCFRISLYQIDSFYIELYYHMVQGLYISLRSFEDVGGLNPYLEDIDISNIQLNVG